MIEREFSTKIPGQVNRRRTLFEVEHNCGPDPLVEVYHVREATISKGPHNRPTQRVERRIDLFYGWQRTEPTPGRIVIRLVADHPPETILVRVSPGA